MRITSPFFLQERYEQNKNVKIFFYVSTSKRNVFSIKSYIGSVVVKCKKKFTSWSVNIFCLKLPNSSRNSIKKFYILKCKIQNVRVQQHNHIDMYGSVALHWQNAKHNVNPGLSCFERCLLACARLIANLHLYLHFAFCQRKATLPMSI